MHNNQPLTLIAGPCQIETYEHADMIAGRIDAVCKKLGVSWIYKSSFDKANRSSINAQRGVPISEGLHILWEIGAKYDVPVLTDVHTERQCELAAQYVDVLQIPAFLCRQTDLLLAAGNTGKRINVKKGQFLAPQDMKHVAEKISSTGNDKIMLTERGTSFGYNNLVVDMRGIEIMKQTGYPVIIDATHSCQLPGGNGTSSGGQRQFVPTIAKAAVALGVAGLFMEVHEDPDNAPSDGPNMLHIDDLESLLNKLMNLDDLVKS